MRAWFSLEAEEHCRVLRITKDGLKVLVLSEGAKGFRVTLYDWVNRNIEASSLCGNYTIRDIKIKDSVQFVTVGVRHIQFWKFSEGELTSMPGDWAKAQVETLNVVEYAFKNNYCFTGSTNGTITTWLNKKANKPFEAHKNSITVLQGHKDRLYSGGKDGKVKIWYYSSSLMPRSDLFYFFDHVGIDIAVSSIMFKPNSEILIASTTGKVFEIGEVGSVTLKAPQISTKVNGFAINNLRKEIIVTSEDGYIQCWNYTTFEVTKYKQTGMPHYAVTYYRDYSRILIADQKGKINIWKDNDQMESVSKL